LDKKLAILGAGNLATRVAIELSNQGIEIIQVFSRTVASALTLSKLIGCPYVTQPEKITLDADIYLIAVSDSAIEELLDKINFNDRLIAHTAGSMNMDILKKYSSNYGVFYPLQTFTKYRSVNFCEIPICIEANSPENEQLLVELAFSISKDVRLTTSEQRKYLHLAAVFANNFTNHMYAIAEEILKQQELPFNIIEPLISETAAKVKDLTPLSAQTGPAVRNDKNVINEHLNRLDANQKLKTIYSILSENIYEFNKKSK
jgi:predicted short-subunit dehydrogenase-like oxidoreductase (DUF2520 family)